MLFDLANVTRVFHEPVAVCSGTRLSVTSAPRVRSVPPLKRSVEKPVVVASDRFRSSSVMVFS